jgi:isocitrate lyase
MARLREVRDSRSIEREWETNPRWNSITRDYTAADVLRLRGSIDITYTLAELGAERLWKLLHDEAYVAALSRSESLSVELRSACCEAHQPGVAAR